VEGRKKSDDWTKKWRKSRYLKGGESVVKQRGESVIWGIRIIRKVANAFRLVALPKARKRTEIGQVTGKDLERKAKQYGIGPPRWWEVKKSLENS